MNEHVQNNVLTILGISLICSYVIYKSLYAHLSINTINYIYISALFFVLQKLSKLIEKLRIHFTLWLIFWLALFVCFFQSDLAISNHYVLMNQLLIIPILIIQNLKNEHK